MNTYIGVDLGGTKIEAGRFDESFVLQEKLHISTDLKSGIKAVLQDVADLIKKLRCSDTIAIGMGIPGFVSKEGCLIKTPNISKYDPINLREYFGACLDLPLYFANDANLFTLAEFEQHKTNIQNMLGLTLGTGLGGGIILNGELFEGNNGFAGEFGHVVFNESQEWEDLISGKANQEDHANRGKYLGMIISSLIYIFNPELISLGGSVAIHTFDKMKEEMWNEIKKRCLPETYADLNIHISELENAGLTGAAILAANLHKNA